MRKKILMIGMTLLMAVAAIGCNGNQQNDNLKIQEQLDLGYKYLNELDYENAIATYMAILEVDAKCVSAYQGIAEVYMAIGDYDSALKYAQEGLENTGDESLTDLIKQIETLMAEVEEARLAEEEAAARKALFEEHCVDDIWHRAYAEYELTEEETTYLQAIIDNAKVGNYEEIFILLQNDTQDNIVLRCGDSYTYDDKVSGTVRMAYNGYKVCANMSEHTYGVNRFVYLIPVTEEKGYYFSYSISGNADGERYINKEYAVCDCKDGMYNGKLTGKASIVSEEANVHQQTDMEGTIVNGLREGLWLFHDSSLNSDYKATFVSEYSAGKPKAYLVESNGSKNIYWTKVKRDENGNLDMNNKSGSHWTAEQYEKHRENVGGVPSSLSPRDVGGYWCYRY